MEEDWYDKLSQINEEVDEIKQHKKATGKIRLVKKFQTLSSVNVLGAFDRQLPMGIKYKNVGIVIPEDKVRMWKFK